LSKKSNARGITIPDFKLYYRAIAINTAWDCHKNRYEDQWNEIEDPDINAFSYSHLIFWQRSLKHVLAKRQPPVCWANWIATCRRLKLDACLSPSNNINSKWIKDLNVKMKLWNYYQKEQGKHWNI
jgi:hypothetical protein